MGAHADGVGGNATVQLSWIITFRETKGLLGGLGLEGAVTAIPLIASGALHQPAESSVAESSLSPPQLSCPLTQNTTARPQGFAFN